MRVVKLSVKWSETQNTASDLISGSRCRRGFRVCWKSDFRGKVSPKLIQLQDFRTEVSDVTHVSERQMHLAHASILTREFRGGCIRRYTMLIQPAHVGSSN